MDEVDDNVLIARATSKFNDLLNVVAIHIEADKRGQGNGNRSRKGILGWL